VRFLRSAALAAQVLGEAATLFIARYFEAIARVLVLAARTPVARPSLAAGRRCRSAPRGGFGALLILRLPQPSARKPLHHRVRMTRLQLPQRRQQFFLKMGAKGGRLSVEDDRPVVVPGRHLPIMAALTSGRVARGA
jgi:hypothetical protein